MDTFTHDTFHPTGNLRVALPEIDNTGRCHSLNVLSDGQRGIVSAEGSAADPLLQPVVLVNGVPQEPELTWEREGAWVPRATASDGDGSTSIRYLVPEQEQGVAARIEYRNDSGAEQHVELRWHGTWATTKIRHLTPKTLTTPLDTREDARAGIRTVYTGGDNLLLALSWKLGTGSRFISSNATGWATTSSAALLPGEILTHDLFIGVSTEPDGSHGTAMHLGMRGFDAMYDETMEWLDEHSLSSGDLALDAKLNLNLFFSFFYSQADCLDTGQPVMLASRSPRYESGGAFWSRDAFWWSFPAILLADPDRARVALIEGIRLAGGNIAHHALYITGTRLFPGFELDQLTAPLIAVWRYVQATADVDMLGEPAILGYIEHVLWELEQWQQPETGLFGTRLLPTDEATEHPFVTTSNATVAVCFEIIAALSDDEDASVVFIEKAEALRKTLRELCIVSSESHFAPGDSTEKRWAWAIDAVGQPEMREEPPLGLRTLSYWGMVDSLASEDSLEDSMEDAVADTASDAAYRNTTMWMVSDYEHHYSGRYPGTGAPRYASPSGADLGNRILTRNSDLGDPVKHFLETPFDNGIGCESWDPLTGTVTGGAAMASIAGFLAWTTWASLTDHARWDDPFSLEKTIEG